MSLLDGMRSLPTTIPAATVPGRQQLSGGAGSQPVQGEEQAPEPVVRSQLCAEGKLLSLSESYFQHPRKGFEWAELGLPFPPSFQGFLRIFY